MRYANDFSKEMFLLILGRDKGRGGEAPTLKPATWTYALNGNLLVHGTTLIQLKHTGQGYASDFLHLQIQSPLSGPQEADPLQKAFPDSLAVWLAVGFSQWEVPAGDWKGEQVWTFPNPKPGCDLVVFLSF